MTPLDVIKKTDFVPDDLCPYYITTKCVVFKRRTVTG